MTKTETAAFLGDLALSGAALASDAGLALLAYLLAMAAEQAEADAGRAPAAD